MKDDETRPIEPMFATISDTQRIFNIGLTKTYELINRGDLEAVHLDRRRLITMASIKRLAARLVDEASARATV